MRDPAVEPVFLAGLLGNQPAPDGSRSRSWLRTWSRGRRDLCAGRLWTSQIQGSRLPPVSIYRTGSARPATVRGVPSAASWLLSLSFYVSAVLRRVCWLCPVLIWSSPSPRLHCFRCLAPLHQDASGQHATSSGRWTSTRTSRSTLKLLQGGRSCSTGGPAFLRIFSRRRADASDLALGECMKDSADAAVDVPGRAHLCRRQLGRWSGDSSRARAPWALIRSWCFCTPAIWAWRMTWTRSPARCSRCAIIPASALCSPAAARAASRSSSYASGRVCVRVEFRPYAQRAALGESLGMGDIGVVTQQNSCCGAVVPSKVYGLLAAGRPVLFIGPAQSTPARIVRASSVAAGTSPAEITKGSPRCCFTSTHTASWWRPPGCAPVKPC